jgi:6-phosphogluconolactonase
VDGRARWFGDERAVPPDDADSNYGMAREALLASVPVPEGQVLRMEGERAPADAAERYDALLRGAFGDLPPAQPAFDLLLLGVGSDGHTASLFPGGDALAERARWAVAVPAPTHIGPHVARVTLTRPALEAAREVLVLVTGRSRGRGGRAGGWAGGAAGRAGARARAHGVAARP